MENPIANMRKSAGFQTQESLSQKLGLKNRATLAKWETGERIPRPEMLVKLASILHVSEGDIIRSISDMRTHKENSA